MSDRKSSNEAVTFVVAVSLLAAVSLLGILAPESVSRLQGSDLVRWSAAIACALLFSFVLIRLTASSPDAESPSVGAGESNWQGLRAEGRGRYVRMIMLADLRRVLAVQPLLVLLVGWVLGWGVNRIVGVVSIINFVTACASFFHGLRQWELNERGRAS
jgi:hypothetical protein